MTLSKDEIIELYKVLKKNESLLTDTQYSIFLKFQKSLYSYFSVDQLERFNNKLEEE